MHHSEEAAQKEAAKRAKAEDSEIIIERVVRSRYGFDRTRVPVLALSHKTKPNPSLDPALLCSNEHGTQLYIQGGDQSVSLSQIHMDDPSYKRDSMVLGEAYFVSYFTGKDFDKFQPTIYEHDIAEESDPPSPRYKRDETHTAKNRRQAGTGTGYYPTVRYDALNRKLYLDGGCYKIEKPLFQTSPGIEN